MNKIVLNLLEVSVYSCLMVMVVLALRALFHNAAKSTICLLWILVGIRLIVFIPIESKYAIVPEIFSTYINVDWKNNDEYGSILNQDISSNNTTVNSDISLRIQQYTNESRNDDFQNKIPKAGTDHNSETIDKSAFTHESSIFMSIISSIWLIGMLTMLLYGIIRTVKIKKRLSTAIKDSYEKDVFYTEYTKSAFVFGLIKPKIYVGFFVDEKDKNYIIAHEREHLRRKDYIFKLMGYMLLSIYWFAPWLWVAFMVLCKDMELACDEGVISSMNSEQRACYAGILCKYGSKKKIPEFRLVQFGEVSIKERIKKIMNFKKKSIWITCILLTALVMCIVLFVPVRNSKATDKPEDSTTEETNISTLQKTGMYAEDTAGYENNNENWSEELDKLYKYLDKESGELLIPEGVSEISSPEIAYFCTVHAKERPLYVKVDENNDVFDSRNNCNAIIETSTGRLIFGCENTVIQDSITEIADNAFANCAGLTTIKIPNNVTKIGKNAFKECGNLQEVILPEGITEVSIGAFSICGSLASVSLPESVITIGDSAFSYCGRLTQINLSEDVIENGLGEDSFTGCYSLNKKTKDAILEYNPNAYRLNRSGDDLSNVEYHFKEEAPELIEYPQNYYYGVLDAVDQFGNLSIRVVKYSEEENRFVYTGITKTSLIADDCEIIVQGKTEKSEYKPRRISLNDLRYICDYYMVATDKNDIEEIIMNEYVFPFICEEENSKIISLREFIE